MAQKLTPKLDLKLDFGSPFDCLPDPNKTTMNRSDFTFRIDADACCNDSQLSPQKDSARHPNPDSVLGQSQLNGFFFGSLNPSQNNSVRRANRRGESSFLFRSPSPEESSPFPPLLGPPPVSAFPKIDLTVVRCKRLPKYLTTKNQRLIYLYDSLMKIFLQDPTPIERLALEPEERVLLVRIVKRKFAGQSDPTVDQLMSEFQSEMQRVQPVRPSEMKRKEEKIKFIYKMVLKRIRRRFEQERGLPTDEQEAFYQTYFGDTAARLRVPLSDFHDPSNANAHRARGTDSPGRFKTINTEFLNLVFSCERFKAEFVEYLQSTDLLRDYHEKLGKKIRKLLTRWNKLVGKVEPQELVSRADDYFIRSERCKLPWAISEVEAARQHFMQHTFRVGRELSPS